MQESKSITRYFKLIELNAGTFKMIENQTGQYIQTTQIPGLETRCKGARRGFHFWAFLPDNSNVVKCLACGLSVRAENPRAENPPASPVEDHEKSSGTP